MPKPKRNLRPEFKFQVVIESLKEEKSQAEIAREYDVHPQLITNWKRQLLKEGPKIFTNLIFHQDQDSVFTSYEYAGTLLNDGITLSFTEKGFKDNPVIESCIGQFKEDYEDLIKEAKNLKEAKKIIQRSIRDWNENRIHSGLKGRSPDEFLRTFFKL